MLAEYYRRYADRFIVVISFLCFFDCVLLPFLTLLTPVFTITPGFEEMVHVVVRYIMLPIAFLSLSLGFFRHRVLSIPLVGYFGLLTLGYLHYVMPGLHEQFLPNLLLTGTGSALLIIAQFRNIRTRKCYHCAP